MIYFCPPKRVDRFLNLPGVCLRVFLFPERQKGVSRIYTLGIPKHPAVEARVVCCLNLLANFFCVVRCSEIEILKPWAGFLRGGGWSGGGVVSRKTRDHTRAACRGF